MEPAPRLATNLSSPRSSVNSSLSVNSKVCAFGRSTRVPGRSFAASSAILTSRRPKGRASRVIAIDVQLLSGLGTAAGGRGGETFRADDALVGRLSLGGFGRLLLLGHRLFVGDFLLFDREV